MLGFFKISLECLDPSVGQQLLFHFLYNFTVHVSR
jgi:hypothetical protein